METSTQRCREDDGLQGCPRNYPDGLPWRGLDDVELDVVDWIEWCETRRLHGKLGMTPPFQFQAGFARVDGDLDLEGVNAA